MFCCCKKSISKHDLSSSLLDGEGFTDTSSMSSDRKEGPVGGDYPSWMDDSDTETCMSSICSKVFSVYERKHHCRRCRNIYCNSCTSHHCKILLFSINDEVRVCDRCYLELGPENKYVRDERPILSTGAYFKKSIHMGFSHKTVSLRRMNDTTLVYDDDTRREPKAIYFYDIQRY